MVLYVNACVRSDSRTDRIAKALLRKLGGEYEEVKLAEEMPEPLSGERLQKRTELIETGDYADPMFRLARQFQAAEQIVIAAPYWDLSFPAGLKAYLENIYVTGLVSEYGADGMPHGLCMAKKLFYVTTAGGPYVPDFSYDYLRALAVGCFGIPETELIKAEMLDVEGYDADALVNEAIESLRNRRASNADRTGIIGAMDAEVASLKSEMKIASTRTIAGMEFCEGTINGKAVVVVRCGMGKVNAGICAHTLINTFGVSRVINTGVAGSLDNAIDIGDIVVSTDAVQHDFDVSPIGFARGEIPYTGLYAFPADETLRAQAVSAAKEAAPDIQVFEGRVCSGDQFIASREQRETIFKNFGGECCEMEGGAIAQTCYLNNTPFVIIRAISDKADDSEELSFQVFEEAAAARCAAIVRYMVADS